MDESTANGLRMGGALMVVLALALPWYTVHVGGELTAQLGGDPSLDSVSGWDALGGLRWLALAGVAAIAVNLPAQARGLAALGVLVLAGIRWSAPPSASEQFAGQLPETGNAMGDAFGRMVIDSFTQQLGLELRPSYGLALCAAGAAAALAGSLQAAPRPAMVPARGAIG